jgi:hypothetical protein
MVNYAKGCFTIAYHLCHIDDQSILAAVVHTKKIKDSNYLLPAGVVVNPYYHLTSKLLMLFENIRKV